MNQTGKLLKFEIYFGVLLWTGVVILTLTLLIFSFFRMSELYDYVTSQSLPPEGTIEYGYARQPVLTFSHIIPGTLFILLGALQFIKPLRNRFINVHRWVGRLYLLLGLLVGFTAIAMGFLVRFGGMAETSAVTIFGIYFIFCLISAYQHIRKGKYNLHREWMLRAYSIGLAVATMRPVIGLLFAFTDIPFSEFFGYTFWFSFIVHFTIAEIWIRFTRKTSALRKARTSYIM